MSANALERLSKDFAAQPHDHTCPGCARRQTEARVVIQVKSRDKSQRTWATRTRSLCGDCAASLFRRLVAEYESGEAAA